LLKPLKATSLLVMLVDAPDVIRLDVGGHSFTTSRRTLVRAGALYRTVSAWQKADAIVIDRDPEFFGTILAYLRDGTCTLPDTTAQMLALRAEAEAYQVGGLLRAIDGSSSMRVHRRLAAAALQSRGLLQAAADALLAYAFGRLPPQPAAPPPGGTAGSEDVLSSGFDAIELEDPGDSGGGGRTSSAGADDAADFGAWPGMMADVVNVDVRVALSATAAVQGRYHCHVGASIAGPAAVKELRHEYDGAGPIEAPLGLDNLRSPFYATLPAEKQAIWDEVRFLRRNADAIAHTIRAGNGSCFRVQLSLQRPEQPPAVAEEPAARRPEWRPVFDTTLRFEVRLI